MDKETVASHVHCPRCLEGILVLLEREIAWRGTGKNEKGYTLEVFKCNVCGWLFKRDGLEPIEPIFKH